MLPMLRRIPLRRSSLCLVILGLTLSTSPVSAQDTITFIDPPRGEAAELYLDTVPRRMKTDIQYVDETNIDLLDADARPARSSDRTSLEVGDRGGMGTFFVIFLLAALLFIFLKFGGAGGLLRADPNAEKKTRKRAKGWGLSSDDETAGDILSKVRAMASRKDALVLLLRHCLLQASEETQVFFKRSDTEREAYARLPISWRRISELKTLLQSTELVHYGGRDITDTDFETALNNGAKILMEAR